MGGCGRVWRGSEGSGGSGAGLSGEADLAPGYSLGAAIGVRFLDHFRGELQITFNNSEAEQLLLTALESESCLPLWMQRRIEEVFSPIFFYYPNGVKDRSVWKPRDTSETT